MSNEMIPNPNFDPAVQEQLATTKSLMNVDDTVLHILAAHGGGGPGSSSKTAGKGLVDRSSDQTVAGVRIPAQNIDWNEMLARLGHQVTDKVASGGGGGGYSGGPNTINLSTLQTKSIERYQPVVSQLNRFKFASSEEKRNEQVETIVAAVKEACQKLAISDVATATRSMYANVSDVTRITNGPTTVGMIVTFKLAQASINVKAKGEFCGDEIICCEQDGHNASAYVVRPKSNGFEDVSGNFALSFSNAE